MGTTFSPKTPHDPEEADPLKLTLSLLSPSCATTLPHHTTPHHRMGTAFSPKSPHDSETESLQVHHDHDNAPSQGKLGTLTGVYIPCVQNILGIIFYIRLSWIEGIAGVSGSLMVVAVTCATVYELLTAVSSPYTLYHLTSALCPVSCALSGVPCALSGVPCALSGVPCALSGVPCAWHGRIVGIAGVSGSLMVVAVTCASTFITALSLSAVVTNGAMKHVHHMC
ncbi:unnamed protein product [Closterium sp. Naga37s-1]|nr:unnamed protein product [Closterium sp. Naga37s-1]